MDFNIHLLGSFLQVQPTQVVLGWKSKWIVSGSLDGALSSPAHPPSPITSMAVAFFLLSLGTV